jgi:outer membrane protein OmpA-like peptidoglycan-associated protein
LIRIALLALLLATPKPAATSAVRTGTAPAAGDLVDLLDFDQGTVPLSSPPSYGQDVGNWSPFRLTDGDEKAGWCSAQGKATGGEFVWELDGDATLSKLRIQNTGVQESGYPGISAHAVELWGAAADGPFQKLGSFEAAKGADREFPLPPGKPVRRVKLVVASNHGHAAYTEIMEVDLLGKKLAAPATANVGGDYYSRRWNGLRMKQAGTHVDGCYDYSGGRFSGELEGRVAKVAWTEIAGKSEHRGTATFVVAADRSWVRGVYFNDQGALAGAWDLAPAKPDQAAKCRPAEEGLGAQLKQAGRLALYGIHFDVDSDVPRPDSEPTLQQLLQLLQGEATLALQVEGHTDATNTDAYNLQLSERRARAVVRWLTEHGVDGGRLTPKGIGRDRPVASNATAQGRALNRRVEVALPGK